MAAFHAVSSGVVTPLARNDRSVLAEFAARDKLHAENHKYNAQSYRDALQREYEIKKSLYEKIDMLKPEFESALAALRLGQRYLHFPVQRAFR